MVSKTHVGFLSQRLYSNGREYSQFYILNGFDFSSLGAVLLLLL